MGFKKFIKNQIQASNQQSQVQAAQKLAALSDEQLRRFIPDVYQEDIYQIDYQRLWDRGIRLLSFDIDDTIRDSGVNKIEGYLLDGVRMPESAVAMFHELKKFGFTLALLSNTKESIVSDTCEQLGANWYIAQAQKPHSQNFEKLLDHFGVDRSRAAHVGNSMIDDIYGGNHVGVTTCLVRRNGVLMKVPKIASHAVGLQTKGDQIRQELLQRGMWRKHHKYEKGDQYYQLGEIPKYKSKILEK